VIEIPQRLREVVGEGHPGGPAWLEQLPGLVEDCLAEWRLTLGELFGSTFSYVARVTRADGTPAVLKLTLPEHAGDGEAEALRRWGGDGAVLVLESSRERSALLLELVSRASRSATGRWMRRSRSRSTSRRVSGSRWRPATPSAL
jgi:Aminoglycoside/hydroxyurea antibiotic resistance kinase